MDEYTPYMEIAYYWRKEGILRWQGRKCPELLN